jgi:radical SAM protein with 4Fe4S-binding SPASM domain
MECTQAPFDREEYMQSFRDKVVQHHIPLFGSIELTHRCNLRCLHCYLGDHPGGHEKEIGTERLFSVIDEITEAGCLFLLLTGGEPLLRKDFPEIYRHAKIKGLMVTVFTNGTLIADPILELFEDLPPQAVEISLYGTTAATYEKITGVKGSFERCLTGIRRLLEHKINVRLKTVLMTLNCHELFEMERMAQECGVKFRFDAAISARLNGDRSPLRLRVSAGEAAKKEFSDDLKIQQWREHINRYSDRPTPDTLYNCGAGIITFHITPDGHLQPCLMTTRLTYDLSSGGFMKGWREVMPRVREIKVGPDYLCNRCEKRVLCSFCPPSFELENGMGAPAAPSEYHCALSQRRLEFMSNHL